MTIEGSGTFSFFETPYGNLHVVASGTATDGNGGFWRWNYAQNARPLGDGAFEVSDSFNLVGSGSRIKLHSHFVIAFTSADLEDAEVLYVKQFPGIRSSAIPSSGDVSPGGDSRPPGDRRVLRSQEGLLIARDDRREALVCSAERRTRTRV